MENNIRIFRGVVLNVFRKNEEGTWGVYDIGTLAKKKPTRVSGEVNLHAGDNVELTTIVSRHEKWGKQYKIKEWKIVSNSSVGTFLAAHTKGLGKKYVSRILKQFGEEGTIDMLNKCYSMCIEDCQKQSMSLSSYFAYLEETPGDLPVILGKDMPDIQGIGNVRFCAILNTWAQRAHEWQVVNPICEKFRNTLSYAECKQIASMALEPEFVKRKVGVLEYLEQYPYEILRVLRGRSFGSLDPIIVQIFSLQRDDPRRLRAGMIKIASKAEGFCIPIEKFQREVNELLNLPATFVLPDTVRDVIVEFKPSTPGASTVIYSPDLWDLEEVIVSCLNRLKNQTMDPIEPEGKAEELDEQQLQAICMALKSPVSIINGQAGTGKTTVIRFICSALSPTRESTLSDTEFGRHLSGSLGKKRSRGEFEERSQIHLLAPTGKAAQRIAEKSGLPARTIHKLVYKREDPIYGTVIIDESSMISAEIFATLLGLMDESCRLVLIGDAAQLPPVGRGRIFIDLVESGKIPTTTLLQVHRQREGGILHNAYIIQHAQAARSKMSSLLRPSVNSDEFVFWDEAHCKDNEDCITSAVQAAGHFMIDKHMDPHMDIQVITPHNKTANLLNEELRQLINPPSWDKEEVQNDKVLWRMNDKVICVRNQYREVSSSRVLVVANGEQGKIISISDDEIGIYFPMTGRTEAFCSDPHADNSWDAIKLGYAITVHKSQGSEYKAVIFVITSDTCHLLLTRKLLYTGFTRASENLVLIAHSYKVSIAMDTKDSGDDKWSMIAEKLIQ